MAISDRSVAVTSNTDNSVAFGVKNAAGSSTFNVDTTNNEVKALGTHTNTQYANFICHSALTASFAAGYHNAIPFENSYFITLINFGNGTDPATTFTTAEGAGTRASELTTFLWYLPDNISIDGITSIEGADTATGDTTRFHLMSYTFTSGATACLTEGVLVGHSNDQTNAGSEQPYLNTWTVDSASVASGKVLVATIESDSINSDYSARIKVKYHLT